MPARPAEGEGEHVDAVGADAEGGGHGAVLHDGADLEAEGGAGEDSQVPTTMRTANAMTKTRL
jgi:hypothetical protein